jgi:hypothetical protein
MSGSKKEEVMGGWRRLHNVELHDIHASQHIVRVISRKMRLVGHVARMDEMRNIYNVLIIKPEGKRGLRRPKRRWEDNIRMDLREIACEDVYCIHLAQDLDQWRALVNMVINLRIP